MKNVQDLKDVTHDVHYENYRLTCLGELRAQVENALSKFSQIFLKTGNFDFLSLQGIAVGDTSMERKRMSSKRFEIEAFSLVIPRIELQYPGRALPRRRASTKTRRR